MGNSSRKYFCTYSLPATTWLNWMSSVPDEKSLMDMSIPGTNNTLCCDGWTRCQSWPLIKQYEAGIRFIDIRCQHINDQLLTQNGSTDPKKNFTDVLAETIAFLKEHPTETILLYIRDESAATQDQESFQKRVTESIKEMGSTGFWQSSGIPTLGQARGKIIILQNCIPPLCGIGATDLDVHDEWEVPTLFYVNERWSRLESRLQVALEKKLHPKLFLTFCSGHGWLALSESVATWMNFYLYSYLEGQVNEKTRLGVIIMDFPGAELVQLIIHCNDGV